MSTRPVAIVDRDGTIVRDYPDEQWPQVTSPEFLPGAASPRAGLVERALAEHPELTLDGAFVVGDSATDAGLAVTLGIPAICLGEVPPHPLVTGRTVGTPSSVWWMQCARTARSTTTRPPRGPIGPFRLR